MNGTTKRSRILLSLAIVTLAGVGFAAAAEAQITITHEPFRQFVTDTDNGYIVKAKITSSAGTINVRRVFWAKNGTSYQQLFMQPTGRPDEYSAVIPATNRNSTIRYYVRAADTASNILTAPVGAPGLGETSYIFHVGHYQPILEDDFESDLGWISAATMGEDDWEWGEPNLGGGSADDPLSAYSGVRVRGNDLNGSGNQAGKYPADTINFIDSPTMDCSSARFVRLLFRRWLTVEEGIYDDSIISVNGNIVWRNQDNGHTRDSEWNPIKMDISSFASNQSSVVVRFELQSDAGLEFGGWTLDDFQVVEWVTDWVTMSWSNNNPSIGETIVLTVNANPTTAWYLLDAREPGNGQFQVPGGPLVYSGLHGNSTRNRLSGMTDGAGQSSSNLRVPNRTQLIGVERWTSTVGFASGWIDSNLVKLTVMP